MGRERGLKRTPRSQPSTRGRLVVPQFSLGAQRLRHPRRAGDRGKGSGQKDQERSEGLNQTFGGMGRMTVLNVQKC